MTDWVDVAGTDEIVTGKPVHIDIDGVGIAVFKLDDGIYAIEDVCTHDGGLLTGGCIEDDQIICPRHGARFSIKTGEALTAPAYEPTATFPVRIENGMVQVRDDRWDQLPVAERICEPLQAFSRLRAPGFVNLDQTVRHIGKARGYPAIELNDGLSLVVSALL